AYLFCPTLSVQQILIVGKGSQAMFYRDVKTLGQFDLCTGADATNPVKRLLAKNRRMASTAFRFGSSFISIIHAGPEIFLNISPACIRNLLIIRVHVVLIHITV